MRNSKTLPLALGGVFTAVSVALMFFGSLIPFATFTVPAIASLCITYMMLEFGTATAMLVYAAISLLSLLFVPDKEIAALFVSFFGYYPVVKCLFEKHLATPLCWAAKAAVFNVSTVLMYWVITRVFIVESVRQDFAEYAGWMYIALLVCGNIMLVVFDIGLSKLIWAYLRHWREKLFKSVK